MDGADTPPCDALMHLRLFGCGGFVGIGYYCWRRWFGFDGDLDCYLRILAARDTLQLGYLYCLIVCLH